MQNHFYEKLHRGTQLFPVGVYHTRFPAERSMLVSPHYHDELELFILLSGGVHFYIDRDHYELSPGEGVAVWGNSVHSVINRTYEPYEALSVIFPLTLLTSHHSTLPHYLQEITHKRLTLPTYFSRQSHWGADIWGYIHDIHTLDMHKSAGYELHIQGLLYRILAEFVEHTHQEDTAEPIVHNSLVKRLINYIQAHLEEDLTLERLAQQVYVSKEHVCRVFKSTVHMSPTQYINQCRIARSVSLLADKTLSVAQISFMCGYQNPSYFNKVFKKAYQCTPLEYRAQLLSKKQS